MSFSNTTYLFGLLGVIIPIAIHLWNKKESKIVKVGSIKWLPNEESNKSSSLQLNEIWLLIMRCLMIGLLAFLMAEWLLPKDTLQKDIVLIQPDKLTDQRLLSALDTLSATHEIRLLQEGLPQFNPEEDITIEDIGLSIWELASAINQLPQDTLLIIASTDLNTVSGKRPVFIKTLQWILLEPLSQQQYLAYAFEYNGQRRFIIGDSNSQLTSYKHLTEDEVALNIEVKADSAKLINTSDWVAIKQLDSIDITIVYEAEYEQDKTILLAALKAIEQVSNWPLNIEVATTYNGAKAEGDWLFWCSSQPLPKTEASILATVPTIGNALMVPTKQPNVIHLTKRLNYELSLQNQLTFQLLQLLINTPFADIQEVRQLSLAQIQPQFEPSSAKQKSTLAAAHNQWLWLIFSLLFILERFISAKRKQ